jgi:hypothetical protein
LIWPSRIGLLIAITFSERVLIRNTACGGSRSPTNVNLVAMDKIPLSAEWRRALEMLVDAGERRGMTEGVLRARGFTPEMVESLVACGLATARASTLKVGDRTIKVVRLKITNAGQYVLMSQDRPAVARQPRARNG